MHSNQDYCSGGHYSDGNRLAVESDRRSIFSGKTMLVLGLFLGAAIGFAVTTLQIHAGGNNPSDLQPQLPGASPVAAQPLTLPAAAGNPSQYLNQADTAAAPAPASTQSAPGQYDDSTASGDFVNSQGIVYQRTYVPGPEYPVNPNWTVSRNGLIGNPSVDPASSHGRAYSTPLN